MLLASVDAGSNSIRLLVGDVRSDFIKPILYDRSVTRLAAGMETSGSIGHEALEKTVRVLKEFSKKAKDRGARRISAVGTSAIREAANSNEVLSRIYREAGLEIKTVSGREEALLTAKGALYFIKKPGLKLIVDIGGGSTEFIAAEGDEIVFSETIGIGVVKLYEKHIKSDPPTIDDISSLDGEIEKSLEKVCPLILEHARPSAMLVGVSGTASTLSAIDLKLGEFDPLKLHMHEMTLARIGKVFKSLIAVAAKKRIDMKGLDPERADLIIPGVRFTIKLMETAGFKRHITSPYGLLEGVILELASEVRP